MEFIIWRDDTIYVPIAVANDWWERNDGPTAQDLVENEQQVITYIALISSEIKIVTHGNWMVFWMAFKMKKGKFCA